MRRVFVAKWRALAPVVFALAASWSGAASADGLQPSRDISRHDARCHNVDRDAGLAGEPAGCVRIRGYVPAGSDRASDARLVGPPSPLEPLIRPVVSGIGVVAAPIGSALGQVPFFFPGGRNEQLR
jgi:hypothetical protein